MDSDPTTFDDPTDGGRGRNWLPLAVGLGVFLAVALVGAGALIGLQFSDGDDGKETVAVQTSPTVDDRVAKGVAFVQCMRENGVPNHPDPAADGSVRLGPQDKVDVDSQAFKDAQKKCSEENAGGQNSSGQNNPGNGPPSFDPMPYVNCMRANGMPDFPTPENGQFNFDADPKVFEPAHEKCKQHLPKDAPGPR